MQIKYLFITINKKFSDTVCHRGTTFKTQPRTPLPAHSRGVYLISTSYIVPITRFFLSSSLRNSILEICSNKSLWELGWIYSKTFAAGWAALLFWGRWIIKFLFTDLSPRSLFGLRLWVQGASQNNSWKYEK